MPSTISIESGLFKIKQTKDYSGFQVPEEVLSYQEDYKIAETKGGLFDLSHWSVIELDGKDAKDFLQRMTTVNFKNLKSDTVYHGAFLTGKGGIVVLGMFHMEGENFDLLVPPNQKTAALEHIEKFHFGENFVTADKSDEWALFGFWNPTQVIMEDLHIPADWKPMHVEWRRWKSLNMHIWRDDRRPKLFWIKINRKQAQPLLFELQRLGVTLLGEKLFDYYRLRHGVPALGCEITDKDIILEANIDEAVARNKGCYPGQEVVERIFTYGSVNRKLMRVEITGATKGLPALPVKIEAEHPVGTLVSAMPDPVDAGKAAGLAFINKQYWDSKESFAVAGISLKLK